MYMRKEAATCPCVWIRFFVRAAPCPPTAPHCGKVRALALYKAGERLILCGWPLPLPVAEYIAVCPAARRFTAWPPPPPGYGCRGPAGQLCARPLPEALIKGRASLLLRLSVSEGTVTP